MNPDLAGAVDPGWRTDHVLETDWIQDPDLVAVMAALRGDAFLVGGCVRNALLGEPPGDIDLATPLRPEEVTARLDAAGLRAVPTGIEHGTVTAVAGHRGVEVTTFRADVETDGRRATVAFSTDMSVDASRRDFTMNALYADGGGRVIDPLGGMADLRNRRIRFIGEPRDRIREDYLRILRFFRFIAWYGREGEIEPEGLAACAELADGLEHLARERIGTEMRKLLLAKDPAPAVASMARAGILARCLPGAEPALLAPLVHLEGEAGRGPDWLVRLAALGCSEAPERLRLSNVDARELALIREAAESFEPLHARAYRAGARATWGGALLQAAAGATHMGGWVAVAEDIARGANARMPLRARDLTAAGVAPGPALGALLSRLEERWIASGFSLDKAVLLGEALGKGQKR